MHVTAMSEALSQAFPNNAHPGSWNGPRPLSHWSVTHLDRTERVSGKQCCFVIRSSRVQILTRRQTLHTYCVVSLSSQCMKPAPHSSSCSNHPNVRSQIILSFGSVKIETVTEIKNVAGTARWVQWFVSWIRFLTQATEVFSYPQCQHRLWGLHSLPDGYQGLPRAS